MITKLAGSIGSISADVHSDTGGFSPPSQQKKDAKEEGLKKENPLSEDPKEGPHLKIVETPMDPDAFFNKALGPPPVVPPPEEPKKIDPNATGQTGALVAAFTALQKQKAAIVQWLGSRTYAATRSRGKRTAVKKGIIVNKQVD